MDNSHKYKVKLYFVDKDSFKETELPDNVFFNKEKKTTTLLKDNKTVTVKCGENEMFSKRIGFLEAYFQLTSGLSKTGAMKYLDKLEKDKDNEFSKKKKKAKNLRKEERKQFEKELNKIFELNETQDKTLDMIECLVRSKKSLYKDGYVSDVDFV